MGKDTVLKRIDLPPRPGGAGPIGAFTLSDNVDRVDGFHAFSTPRPGALLALDSRGQFPPTVFPAAGVGQAAGHHGVQYFGPTAYLAVALGAVETTIQVTQPLYALGDYAVLSWIEGNEHIRIITDAIQEGPAYAYGIERGLRSSVIRSFPAGATVVGLGQAGTGGHILIDSASDADSPLLKIRSNNEDGSFAWRLQAGRLGTIPEEFKALWKDAPVWADTWGLASENVYLSGNINAQGGRISGRLDVTGSLGAWSGQGQAGVVMGEQEEGGYGIALLNENGRPVFAAISPYEDVDGVKSEVVVWIEHEGKKALFYHVSPTTGRPSLDIAFDAIVGGRLRVGEDILIGEGDWAPTQPNFQGLRLSRSDGWQGFGADFAEEASWSPQTGRIMFGGGEGWLYRMGIAIDRRLMADWSEEWDHSIHWYDPSNYSDNFIGAAIGGPRGELIAAVRRYHNDIISDVSAQSFSLLWEAHLRIKPGPNETTYLYGQLAELRGDESAALVAGDWLNPARAILTATGRFSVDRITVGGTAIHVTEDGLTTAFGTTTATGARVAILEDGNRPALRAMRNDNSTFFDVTLLSNRRTYLTSSGALYLGGGAIDATGFGLVAPYGYTRLGSQEAPWQAVYAVKGHFSTLGSQTTLTGKFFLSQRHMTLAVDLGADDTTAYAREGDLPVGDFHRFEDPDDDTWEVIRINTTGVLTGDGWYEYEVDREADGVKRLWRAFSTGASLGGNATDGYVWWYGTDDLNPGTGPALVVMQRDNDDHPRSISPRGIWGNMAGFYGYPAGYPKWGVAFGRHAGRWVALDDEQGLRIMHNDQQRAVYREYTLLGSETGNNVYISDSSLALRVGATSFIAMDNTGDMDLAGELAIATGGVITWAGGLGTINDTGIYYEENADSFFRLSVANGGAVTISTDSGFTNALHVISFASYYGAIYGKTEGQYAFGVKGESDEYGCSGVYGDSHGDSAFGIWGRATGSNGVGVFAQALTLATTALKISGGIVDGGSQRYTNLADAADALDAINRQTGDGRYSPIANGKRWRRWMDA